MPNATPPFAAIIDHYLDVFRSGDADTAFHALLEIDREILPELMDRFHESGDTEVREFLVKVIWEYRDPSVITFLGEVLFESEPCVWQEAFNGLVALACPETMKVLHTATLRSFLSQENEPEFRRWLEEAIEQVTQTLPQDKVATS